MSIVAGNGINLRLPYTIENQMSTNVWQHIVGMYWVRYRLGVVFLSFFTLLMLAFIGQDWLQVELSLQSKIPLADRLFPTAKVQFDGWSMLGLFGFMPLLTAFFMLLYGGKRGVVWFAASVWVASLVHVLNTEVMEMTIDKQVPESLSLDGSYLGPVWIYFLMLGLQTLVVVGEGYFKQAA